MTRHINWDEDGLRVWCDSEGCTAKTQCEECEEAYDIESEWESYENFPYLPGPPSRARPEGKR